MNDWTSDMIARIRNSQMRGSDTVRVCATRFCGMILDVLKSEGFISGYEKVSDEKGKPWFDVALKYHGGRPVIRDIKRISRPGLRRYSSHGDIPLVGNGLGIAVMSTSRGVVSDSDARSMSVGGEVICTVF